ncbi:hypothetical protein V5799_001110 [Amblyomma americanum]|uniref:Uncharacterized protein n=1 Tax=Amblyomma americanum TaxID=6943 RepID=A0AAQ4D148_AMBAM
MPKGTYVEARRKENLAEEESDLGSEEEIPTKRLSKLPQRLLLASLAAPKLCCSSSPRTKSQGGRQPFLCPDYRKASGALPNSYGGHT